MAILWGVITFNYYLIMFLVNSFEQVFFIAIMIGIAEIVAFAISGCLLDKIGVKSTFLVSFTLTTFAGMLILIYGLEH